MEIWKGIKDFCDYEISNKGRLKSKNRIVVKNRNGKTIPIEVKERIIIATKKHEHKYLSLVKDKIRFPTSIHRDVFKAFKGDIPKGMVVNHIDGDKSNNEIENLECITQSENIIHAYNNGLFTTQQYKRNKKI